MKDKREGGRGYSLLIEMWLDDWVEFEEEKKRGFVVMGKDECLIFESLYTFSVATPLDPSFEIFEGCRRDLDDDVELEDTSDIISPQPEVVSAWDSVPRSFLDSKPNGVI